jgi:hypothetical protein
MEIYICLGVALFGFLFTLLVPILNLLPKWGNWKEFSDPSSYFIISICSFSLADDLVKQIHPQGADPEHTSPTLACIAIVLFGLSVIGAAFGVLRRTNLIRRWIIFPIIALGIVGGFVLILRSYVDRGVIFAVYAVPQLLLFFAKKREDTTPASSEQGPSIVGTEASKL